MASIEGRVIYNQTRLGTTGVGIPNVPVCLYCDATLKGCIARTDNIGNYSFTDVPNQKYRIIECWGSAGIAPTLSYITDAVDMTTYPKAADPPISVIVPAVVGANGLNSYSPNTLFVQINNADSLNNNFYDGPINNRPLSLTGGSLVGPNLITAADNGTWGSLPDGSPVNTIPAKTPYPGLINGLEYVGVYPPTAEQVTIDNITAPGDDNYDEWWLIPDHTTGMETGRMLVVNGGNPGAIFFRQTLTVKPHTYYCLTMWITNMNNPAKLSHLSDPAMGIKIITPDGNVLYNQVLKTLPPTTIPQWTQLGGYGYTEGYTTITVELSTQNPDPIGNDFSVDDIVLKEVSYDDLIVVDKDADPAPITVGETMTYTVTIRNKGSTIAKGVSFKDTLQSDIAFIPGSLKLNGSPTAYIPSDGFLIGDMNPSEIIKVTYQVKVNSCKINPIKNTAQVSYVFFTSQSGDIFDRTVTATSTVNIMAFNLRQSSIDVVESVTLEQKAISALINAEGQKIQNFIKSSQLSYSEAIKLNSSVTGTLNSLLNLETILQEKIEIVKDQIGEC